MVVPDAPVAAPRSITGYVLLIIALIVAVSVTILLLLARSEGELHRSAVTAADYHLTATVRVGAIEQNLWEIDRHLRRPRGDAAASRDDAFGVIPVHRAAFLIERELRALEASQRDYAQSTFEAPLRRVLDQGERFAIEVLTLTGDKPEDATIILERVARLRLRLDQFGGLHWKAYAARDVLAERAAGWRRFSQLSTMVSVAALILIGIATRQIVAAIRERRITETRQRIMRAELDHRVKNNLAAVLSLADQTVRSSSDLDEFVAAFTGRIVAMAKTHEALAAMRWSGVDLAQAASKTLAAYIDGSPARVTIDGNSVLLPAEAAMPVCLVLHELSTNAAKHGALSSPDGRVSLSWATHGGCIDLSWEEHGGPVVVEPKCPGLGMQLIEGFIRHELRGDMAMDYRPEGLACRFSLPINADSPVRD